MRKFASLMALGLLAASGTGYAVTCAYDNVPGATLLVPYWKVSSNGTTGGDITEGGIDTLCAITNVSGTGLVAHMTVWNKYSKPVVDWNVVMTGYDVAFWRMKDILNGKLNFNTNAQRLTNNGTASGVAGNVDPCGLNYNTNPATYAPVTGFAQTRYIRFANPDSSDAARSISVYQTPAFSGSFRARVWDALDESNDIIALTSPGGANILDVDNSGCQASLRDGVYTGNFSGYLTIDVVNYCSNYFPEDAQTYQNDVIATRGWGLSNGFTPNALMGDVFFIDGNPTNPAAGNISGDQMVALEFDARLDWGFDKTFYGRYDDLELVVGTLAPPAWQFRGDGREPLGERYGFRYLSDTANNLQSWALVWRGDVYTNPDVDFDHNLCDWYLNCAGGGPCAGYGLYSADHQLAISVYDNDENRFAASGGPSGGGTTTNLYVFLETQRISLLSTDYNPGGFKGGWIDVRFPSNQQTSVKHVPGIENQAWVGIQHSGPAGAGLLLSVGHGATLLNNQFLCVPIEYTQSGNYNDSLTSAGLNFIP